MGKDHSDKETHKVFDWVKAAELIKKHCMIGNTFNVEAVASAGLQEDWSCTSGEIFSNGGAIDEDDTYTFLYSSWATPILDIDGEEFECWVFAKDSEFDSKTFWPEVSTSILNQ